WVWRHPSFKAFIERGGMVWCTQYAEYMLEAFDEDYHYNTLEQLSVKYGGTKKLDMVKAMWDAGHKTSEIPADMLIDYLVGDESEGRNAGDVGNTERVFLNQWARTNQEEMLPIILSRMDGYLASCEMEFNGVHVDIGV